MVGWLMYMEQLVEWELTGETEILGENKQQFHIVHHKSNMTGPGIQRWPPLWEAGDWLPETILLYAGDNK
jgi:hypothetical protein